MITDRWHTPPHPIKVRLINGRDRAALVVVLRDTKTRIVFLKSAFAHFSSEDL